MVDGMRAFPRKSRPETGTDRPARGEVRCSASGWPDREQKFRGRNDHDGSGSPGGRWEPRIMHPSNDYERIIFLFMFFLGMVFFGSLYEGWKSGGNDDDETRRRKAQPP